MGREEAALEQFWLLGVCVDCLCSEAVGAMAGALARGARHCLTAEGMQGCCGLCCLLE